MKQHPLSGAWREWNGVTSHRLPDRKAVDPEQVLDAALRVEALLVGLACLATIDLVALGIPLDISNSERQRSWVARLEQDIVPLLGDEFGERPVACSSWEAHPQL